MRHITVEFDDGDSLDTNINGNDEEIARHYLGRRFEAGCDTKHHHAVIVRFNDTGAVASACAKAIENGFVGKVIAVEKGPNGTNLLKMAEVDPLAFLILGMSAADSVDADDFQWFSPADVRYVSHPKGVIYAKEAKPCL